MSYKNLDHIILGPKADQIDDYIKKNLRDILRYHHQNSGSAVKRICKKTGTQERTAKNWYNGLNPPCSGNLILLARNYPEALEMILELVGHSYLIPYISLPNQKRIAAIKKSKTGAVFDQNVPINVPIKLLPIDLNQRQQWFFNGLRNSKKMTARNIIERWSVTQKTAQRDISDLKKRGLIKFKGGTKAGRYEVIP